MKYINQINFVLVFVALAFCAYIISETVLKEQPRFVVPEGAIGPAGGSGGPSVEAQGDEQRDPFAGPSDPGLPRQRQAVETPQTEAASPGATPAFGNPNGVRRPPVGNTRPQRRRAESDSDPYGRDAGAGLSSGAVVPDDDPTLDPNSGSVTDEPVTPRPRSSNISNPMSQRGAGKRNTPTPRSPTPRPSGGN